MSLNKAQDEFLGSIEGNLSAEDVNKLLGLEGDTGTQLPDDSGSAPGTATIDNETGKPVDDASNTGEGGKPAEPATAPAAAPAAVEHNADNTVILAKDGKHTISYDKLIEARNGEQQAKASLQTTQAQLEAANAELASLREAAQVRADAGQAPTKTDNQVAAAQAAIDAGVNPEIFGDFSEEALAKGISQLVNEQVAARVSEALAAQDTKIAAQLAPIQQAQQVDATEAHYRQIYEKHPDADSLAESKELADWIASQPGFARDAYAGVLQNGSAAQVVELFDTFKKSTQNIQPPPAQGNSQQAADDVKAKAQAAIAGAKGAVPHSLSDIPGGKGAATSRTDAMADMDNGADLLAEMDDMTPAQIEAYLNRNM